MQSTEEYLDQLLASVSEGESTGGQDLNHDKKHMPMKSIEELDESELTEEALQKQLALLLGLETEEDMNDYEEEDDFISQYSSQVAEDNINYVDSVSIAADEIMDIPDDEFSMEEPSVLRSEPEIGESVTEASIETSVEEPVVEQEPVSTPQISETGVLSADEIAALFASMGADESIDSTEDGQEELISALMEEAVSEPEMIVEEAVVEAEPATAPQVSETGVLSPDEIAALFASMGAEESIDNAVEEQDEHISDLMTDSAGENEEDNAALTREELEELGLGDIADVLVNTEAEVIEENIASENNVPEEEKVEILDFDFDEEMLLDIENVDAMLEATAKLAEEEHIDDFAADMQAEEDIMSMLTQFEEESIQESIANEAESAKAAQIAVEQALEEEESGIPSELLEEAEDTGKKKKEKKQKVKKEKVKKVKAEKEKSDKPSIKDKLFAFMFEEENLDEAADTVPEDGVIAATDDLLEEKPVKAKKEKAAKKEKKAKKKVKEGKAQDENAAIEAELAEEDKKKAKKKKDKPAKEKKAKKVVIAEKTPAEIAAEKREAKRSIGTKGIVATLLVCASLLGLILVGTYFLPKQLSLIAARTAFYAQDYEEAAMRLKGQNLNDSDQIMYEKATLLFGLEERYHQYEIYVDRGMDKEALNCLLQGVVACNKEEILVGQLGIETEWKLAKQQFVDALQNQYGLSSETVETICDLRNPDYTVAVENIIAGRIYDDMSAYGGGTGTSALEEGSEVQSGNIQDNNGADENVVNGLNPDEMEDLLPEEEAIIEQLQQENKQEAVTESDASEEDNELYSGSVEGGTVNFVE